MTTESWQPAEPMTDAAPEPRRLRWPGAFRPKVGLIAASVLALAYVAGIGVWAASANTSGASTTAKVGTMPSLGGTPSGTSGGGHTAPGGTTAADAPATSATAPESAGLVLINTVLGYDGAAAAGTGMVLTSAGLVLTNNHVIDGSTEISVTIPATGKAYTASVVGTDPTDDVALLQLQGASSLTTVTLDTPIAPAVGDSVTAVGNASGGGSLLAADGLVTQVDSTVTASTGYTVQGETLGGMITFDAAVVAGDSGGALLDNRGGVVGMTTAASVGSPTIVGYAIPIKTALAIANRIEAGDTSHGVELGYPAFLGVAIARDLAPGVLVPGQGVSRAGTVTGAWLTHVFANTPAASAGLVAGDTITALGGLPVTSPDGLSTVMSGLKPGDSVRVTWTDTSGATRSATVTLMKGPAA